MKTYYVYIVSSKSRVIYIGVTNNLAKRVYEHKEGKIEGFTRKYKTNRLVYYEQFNDIYEAITREKQIKGWLRIKKLRLIEGMNPTWNDLYYSLV